MDMAKRGRVSTTSETDSGRNTQFRDNQTGADMTRAEFVRHIEGGNYPNYHVRVVEGVKTPASNPDTSESNNLG